MPNSLGNFVLHFEIVVNECEKVFDDNTQEYSGSMVHSTVKSTRYSVKIPITLIYIAS